MGRWGLFLLAALYVGLVLRLAPSGFVGDESNYFQLATNLTHGYFSPPDTVQLWYGPGYPLFLAPFVALQWPLLALRLLNVGLALLTVWLSYRLARLYVSRGWALAVSVYVALYVPMLEMLPRLITEWLTATLILIWAYAFTRMHRSGRITLWTAVAAMALASLALTKALFGYVILVGLIATGLIWLINRSLNLRRWAVMYALALVLCVPFLVYTFALTSHVFYWGSQGGSTLYWMSTPYTGELGEWHSFEETHADPRLNDAHRAFFSQIEQLPEPARDDALRQRAFANISGHPTKYLANWIANLGRLLLDYPYSFATPGKAVLLNALEHLPLIGLLVATVASRPRPSTPALGMAMLFVIAFGGSTLLSAYVRQFAILAPLLLVTTFAMGADGYLRRLGRPIEEVVIAKWSGSTVNSSNGS